MNPNHTKLTASYDGAKRVTGLLHQNISTSQIINQFAYGYDKEDNRLFEKRVQDSKGDLFRYDSIYRLNKAQYEVPSSQIDDYIQNGTEPITFSTQTAYNLDGVGNRVNIVHDGITTTYTTNILNQYTYVSTTNYTYDYNGNLKDDGTYLYSYDYRNQLMEIKRKSDEVVIASYQYDAFGRRIQKYNNLQQTTTRYYYSGSQIIEEYNGSDQLQAKFVYGNGIDEVLTMDRNSHTYYYHTNALGSVTEITDEDGVITETYKYDAYGKVSIYDGSGNPITQSAIGNIYYYTGRQLDNESGLYYYRARYYSADMGRFLQRDPIGDDDLFNLYTYVLNSPINFIDPTGLYAEDTHRYRTTEWALSVGIDCYRAIDIGVYDDQVDIDTAAHTSSDNFKLHYMDKAEAERRLQAAIDNCGDPKEFGSALHSFQDWFSHMVRGKGSGFRHVQSSVRNMLARALTPTFGGVPSTSARDTDAYIEGDSIDMRMKEETIFWLTKLKEHYDEKKKPEQRALKMIAPSFERNPNETMAIDVLLLLHKKPKAVVTPYGNFEIFQRAPSTKPPKLKAVITPSSNDFRGTGTPKSGDK